MNILIGDAKMQSDKGKGESVYEKVGKEVDIDKLVSESIASLPRGELRYYAYRIHQLKEKVRRLEEKLNKTKEKVKSYENMMAMWIKEEGRK